MRKKEQKTGDSKDQDSIVENVVDDVLPGMGNLVKKLRRTSPELDRKIEEKDAEIKKRLEEGYSPEPKITYGVKVRTLARDTPQKEEERPENRTIEPLTDIFDEGSFLRIVVELPSVNEEKIRISQDETRLVISASEGGKRYRKMIAMPWNGKVVKKRYQNGILELVMEKNDA
ncbi:MAG: hypothetical protein LUQ31_03085 [Methanoregula sp.]|nr:hypothetical protein [Methanoregula sp.]